MTSAFLGFAVAGFIVGISAAFNFIAMRMDARTGIMVAQSSFLVKLALSGLAVGAIAYGLPWLDLMAFGLTFGAVICTALPILAIIQTR
jgi:hypothetical protein